MQKTLKLDINICIINNLFQRHRKVVIYLIEVKRKGEEKFEILLRRFNREVQQSGILTIAKNKRFFEKEINRSQRRKSSIRKNVIRKLKRGY